MLRLPPTVLGLGRCDIKDYDKRRELAQRKGKKTSSKILNKASYVMPKGSTALAYRPVARHANKSVAATSSKKNRLSSQSYSFTPISTWDNEAYFQLSHLGHIKYSHIPATVSSDDVVVDDFDACSSAESSFYFKDLVQNLPENYYQDTSSLKTSTENSLRSTGISIPRIHIPSHCFSPDHPHNAINTPQFYLESGPVPHVVSRVGSHHSSGILFSQLPKRKGKRPKRASNYKELGNSHEYSESSSVTCEQNRDSMSSVDVMISSPKKLSGLHDNFPSTYSQSSGDVSADSISSQDAPQERISSSQDSMRLTRHLMLPPPFSNMLRSFSATGTIPGRKNLTHPEENFKGTNTSQIFNISDPKNDTEMQSLLITEHVQVTSQCFSPRYSPLQESFDHLDINDKFQLELIPQTPSRSYRVYNDNLTPKIQPQTPANLPEYRHRSRYHPSFTVPDPKRYRRRCSVTGINEELRNFSRHQPDPVVGRSSDYRSRASFDLEIDGSYSHYEAIDNSDE
ncbi:hypothetical protein GcM1_234047 [Golovinomyces cichoracearum]|uniref:Uncharacterized protein n=1 Tax=Golovinomyces cichoracearum TaxID=62708 RepID=A0A420ILB7_9PEZI|nr:hypothetical protein GcM1_234047 [Golovinomyces cichoracearum]